MIVLGLIMIYSVIHLFALQKVAYEKRSIYEKVISWVAYVSIVSVFLGTMFL